MKLTETPPKAALTAALLVLVRVEAEAVNAAEVAPAGTVTLAGTVNNRLSSDSAMTAPPVGAARLRATVQVVEVLDVRVAEPQLRLAGTVGESNDSG
ncbi:hypothetical protein [Paludibaculum fermentans]|uniref:hypothetical protein n=1 Tax=Paludibaculum fermentans TaxID=1473598 RepID=UPI003EBE8427